jgi:hypothetical protein
MKKKILSLVHSFIDKLLQVNVKNFNDDAWLHFL